MAICITSMQGGDRLPPSRLPKCRACALHVVHVLQLRVGSHLASKANGGPVDKVLRERWVVPQAEQLLSLSLEELAAHIKEQEGKEAAAGDGLTELLDRVRQAGAGWEACYKVRCGAAAAEAR